MATAMEKMTTSPPMPRHAALAAEPVHRGRAWAAIRQALIARESRFDRDDIVPGLPLAQILLLPEERRVARATIAHHPPRLLRTLMRN
jgi:hypothetical protein